MKGKPDPHAPECGNGDALDQPVKMFVTEDASEFPLLFYVVELVE
jgi:hypothetical protein